MKRVISNQTQLHNMHTEMTDALAELVRGEKKMMVEFKPFKPPRTRSQSRKIHAMMSELGGFTGYDDMKGYIKTLNFWPTQYKEGFGEAHFVPKSETALTKEEESIIIERLYQLGTMLPGFEFSQ